MNKKNYLKTVLLLSTILVLNGCYTRPDPWVKPRPLGSDYKTFIPVESDTKPDIEKAEIPNPIEHSGKIKLRDALSLALMRNPELRSYSWEVRKAEALSLQAGLMPNPVISTELEDFGGTGDRKNADDAQATFTLSQVIELGFKGSKRRRIADLETSLKAWEYESKRLDVFTNTCKAFIEYTVAIKRLELNNELFEVAKKTRDTIAVRVKKGKDPEVDLKRAEVALSLSRIKCERSKRKIAITRRKLGIIWNSRDPQFTGSAGNIEKLNNIPTFEELDKLIDKNPDIAKWATEAELRQAILVLEKTKRIPDLEITGGIRGYSDNPDMAFLVGVSMAIPILDFNEGNVKNAQLSLQQLPDEEISAKNKIWLSLAETWEELAFLYFEANKLKEKIIPEAKIAYNQTLDRFKKGRGDYLDVLDAQRSFFQTRHEYLQALESFHLKKADAERIIAQKLVGLEKKKAKTSKVKYKANKKDKKNGNKNMKSDIEKTRKGLL